MPLYVAIFFFIPPMYSLSKAFSSESTQEYYKIAKGRVFYQYGYRASLSEGLLMEGSGFAARKYAVMSPKGLEAMALLEKRIYQHVKEINATLSIAGVEQFILRHAKFIKTVQEYLQDYEESSLHLVNSAKGVMTEAPVGVIAVAGNPNAVIRMIKRFRGHIAQWMQPHKPRKESLRTRRLQQLYLSRFLHREYNQADGPGLVDLHISMIAIITMHFHLDLRAEDIAAGRFQGTETGVFLRTIDCLEIGLHAIASGYYVVGIEWLELTVKKSRFKDDSTVDPLLADELLKLAVNTHDANWARKSQLSMDIELFAEPLGKVNGSHRLWNKKVIFGNNKFHLTNEHHRHLFSSVCQGSSHQSEQVKKNLFCWQETEIHPSWKIGPLKVELLSRFPNPEVVQFHDIISNDRDIQRIKDATLLTDILDNEKPFNPLYRLSAEDVVGKHRSPVYSKLSRLVHRITGLHFDPPNNENFIQIAVYPPGGWLTAHRDGVIRCGKQSCHYATWIDQDGKPVDRQDRKIATMLLHLSDTVQGGETGFVMATTKVKPQKGSATFWYNMKSSGRLDADTEHGGCPVVLGEKWSTFWPIYDSQSHLLCDDDREARIEVLVNGKSKYKIESSR